MSVSIVYETHAISTDNEAGIATGWLPGRLSETGRTGARELGERRRDDGIAAIYVRTSSARSRRSASRSREATSQSHRCAAARVQRRPAERHATRDAPTRACQSRRGPLAERGELSRRRRPHARTTSDLASEHDAERDCSSLIQPISGRCRLPARRPRPPRASSPNSTGSRAGSSPPTVARLGSFCYTLRSWPEGHCRSRRGRRHREPIPARGALCRAHLKKHIAIG